VACISGGKRPRRGLPAPRPQHAAAPLSLGIFKERAREVRPMGLQAFRQATDNIEGGIPEADMGLRDIIQGMKNGPRGQPQPSSSGSGGGMSRIMMALLGLLAYKAPKSAMRNLLGGSMQRAFRKPRRPLQAS
jgi:hypothetical protein